MIAMVLSWAFAALLGSIGGYLLVRGVNLAMLGGSWYYLLAGIGLLAVTALILRKSPWGARLYALITVATVGWSLYEAQLEFLPLLSRLGAWTVVGLWFLMPWYRAAMRRGGDRKADTGGLWVGGAILAALLVLTIGAFQRYTVTEGTQRADLGPAEVTDWRHYGNAPGGTRFAQLDQITTENVAGLEEVWRYRTQVPYDFKTTPLQVGERLYFCTAGNRVISIDARSGEELWRYNPRNQVTGPEIEDLADDNMFSRSCRGVGYYEAPSDYGGACRTRIITGTTDARLIALNAETGEPCADFGTGGETNLREGFEPHNPIAYMHTSVPLIAGDKIAVGGWVVDNQELGNVSGVIRAYDVMTGQFAWAWDMGRPDDRGFPREGEFFTRGTPNMWSIMSYDPQLDLIFAPTGNASPDYYGGKRRPFDEEFNSSVIALRGATGDVAWSYQTVHHDIWDYDVPSQPSVVDIVKNGTPIPALVVPTKRGELFVLDRRDGTPVYPATDCPDGSQATPEGECPTPQGAVEGDFVTATQPFSGLPNFRPYRHESDMWGLTPLDHLHCRIEYRKMRYEGHLTPPMRGGGGGEHGGETWGGTFQYPGNGGGFNWPSVSVDTDNGIVVGQPMMMGNRVVMVTGPEMLAYYTGSNRYTRSDTEDEAATEDGDEDRPASSSLLSAMRPLTPYTDQGAWDPSLPRYSITRSFMSRWEIPGTGLALPLPCFEPPYGRIFAMDLNTGTLMWSRAIGNITQSGDLGFAKGWDLEVGTPIYGGLMTTRGGLIFQTGTFDKAFRAIDIRTGETLWHDRLPNQASSTPITYMIDGTQYVVIAVHTYPGAADYDGAGGHVIAYALSRRE